MKKVLVILVSLFMLCSLSACGGPTPTDVADSFLSAIKEQNTEAIAGCYVNDEFDLFEETAAASEGEGEEDSESEEESSGALDKVYDENLLPKMLEFEYELSNEKIDGDKATVDVTVKTYQIGSAFTSFFSDYMTQAFALAFSDPTDEQMDAIAANILTGKLDNLTEKTYEKITTLSLVKKDDNWVVDDVSGNKDVLNALSGGFLDAATNMSTAFGE